jgi:site-specific DNA recombinase
MKRCYGYIRVSTQKQGEGVSLQEQQAAIETFAMRNDLQINEWFEEKETAAKCGRPVFNRMLKGLRQGRADGLIMHKIDRSARNPRDWVGIGELADAGVDVYFVTESLDFRSRGGRLTADIQAVIAADYIRNLREETIKGLQGRLKQGLYPFKAPIGYLDQGRGKPKAPDPLTAPLVREAFERYATGQYTYAGLLEFLTRQGLRNQKSGPLSIHGVETILRNPFYAGVIEIRRTGQTFRGIHEPLVSMALFKRVEAIRTGRRGQIKTRHAHLFRRLFNCGLCHRTMIPELQKGRVYYRCKSRSCPTKTLREDVIDAAVRTSLHQLEMSADAAATVDREKDMDTADRAIIDARRHLELRIADETSKLERLTDLLVDSTIDRGQYTARKAECDTRLAELQQELQHLPTAGQLAELRVQLAELRKSLCLTYDLADNEEKRQFIENVWPNRLIVERSVVLEPSNWLEQALTGQDVPFGDPVRGHGRTFTELIRTMQAARKRQHDSSWT